MGSWSAYRSETCGCLSAYVDLATGERHTDEKAQAIIDAEGSELGFLAKGRKDGMKFE